ncbi:SgcJ/EcaC family oxidoreductase [Micromonospora sp. NPDC047527]|uniref:SgcJ/EcaC family oxidoreductase n=1 Tax=unclassified Micromonospora TaxID=2617518 RepID=UPI0033CB9989
MTTNSLAPDVSADDQAAIAAVPGRIVQAWAAHDADAFADVFTADGTMILPGLFQRGRDDIRDFMAKGFAGPYKGTQVTGQPFDIRVLSTDVALLLTDGGVLGPGETEVPTERAIRASWLLVRTDDGWRLAAYQNSPRDAG